MRGKKYRIKEVFLSIHGEGYNSGRVAVFCRFSGCNLNCSFCDTDFLGIDGPNGGEYDLEDLVDLITSLWPKKGGFWVGEPFVVLTGGEPALQVDETLVEKLHEFGFLCAIETNGTLDLPEGLDWICVSPKQDTELRVRTGDELKVVFPQEGLDLKELEKLNFKYFFLQPINNERRYTNEVIDFCLKNPKWRLSLQIHKFVNLP